MRTTVYLGIDPVTGKPISKGIRYTDQRDLNAKKKALLIAYGRGDVAAKNITFAEFARSWLASVHPKKKTNANTYRMYAGTVEALIKRFGSQKMARIKQMAIEEYLGGRPPHAARIELIVLKSIFRKARKNHYVGDDPAEDIKQVKIIKKTKRDLEQFERDAIMKAVLSDKERAFVLLAYRCGIARGEAIALTPEDITDRVRVRRSAVIDHNGTTLNDCAKTPWRIRSVPIPDNAVKCLQAYAATVTPGELLFGTFDRTRYWRFWNHIKSRINDAAGGKSHYDEKKKYRVIDERKIWSPFSAHVLRHAYCCELYRNGYRPGEVMRLMGHSSVRMSIEIYEHMMAENITASKMNGKKKVFRTSSDRAKSIYDNICHKEKGRARNACGSKVSSVPAL